MRLGREIREKRGEAGRLALNRPNHNFLSIVLACQKLNDSGQFSPEEIAREALLHQSVRDD